MVRCLNDNFGDRIEFVVPSSGIFIWVTFKNEIDSEQLLNAAVEEKVVYLPGESFSIDQKSDRFKNSIRLCFSLSSDVQIIEGIEKLKTVFNKIIE